MNNKDSETSVGKPRRWPKLLGGILLVLLALGVAGYFIATSSSFVKGVILPRVGKAVNADISVSEASVSPFSTVVLRNLKVQTTGGEPLVTANEVRLRYHLMDILGGNFHVDEIALVSPTVSVIQNADGSSNLDPLTKSKPETAGKPGKPSGPPRVDLKKLTLTDATIRYVASEKDGSRSSTELSKVNVTLSDVKNGATGNLTLSAEVKSDVHSSTNAGAMQAQVAGGFDFALADDLKPLSVKGKTAVEVSSATGSLANAAALATQLECEVTPTEIKRVAVSFLKAGTTLGALEVSGPFAAQKQEGRLSVVLKSVDRQLLNLAAAGRGLDFQSTTVSASNVVELTKSGTVINARGRVAVANFQASRAGQNTPVLNFQLDYGVGVNRSAQSLVLQSLVLAATQNQKPFVQAELSSPMTVAWGNGGAAAGDAALNVTVSPFSVGDWSAFAAGTSPSGSGEGQFKLVSRQGGKQLDFDLDARLDDFSARFGTNVVSHADAQLQAKGSAVEFKNFSLSNYQLTLAQRGENALTVNGSGRFDQTTGDAELQVLVRAQLMKLLAIVPQPQAGLASGSVQFQGRLSSQGGAQSVAGELVMTNLAASANPSVRLAAKWNLDATMDKNIADLRRCQLFLTPTDRAKNELTLAGRVDCSNSNAITGALKLAAESLDLGGYYDLMAAPGGTTPKTAPVPTAPAKKTQEPAALTLPFKNFSLESRIDRLYLHAVAVTNFQMVTKLEGSWIKLSPFELNLNGAPVSAQADVNLGVPGFQYDVAFSAKGVPIAPLADTFSPAYRGQAKGTLFAEANLKGAGITEASLHTNLLGKANIVLTNADIQLVGPKAKALITPIAIWLRLNELTSAPMTGLNALVQVGGGALNLSRCEVLSDAYRADTAGPMVLAPGLDDSIIANWPVNFLLARALASKANLMAPNTPTNMMFIPLPAFARVVGTVGRPAVKTDWGVIAGLTARSVAGLPVVVGGDAGKILQGVGNLLTGARAPAATTNAPGTNAAPVNLRDGLWQKK
ncbi:MAG: AsmA family protein [Verrucomicrobiota bacterium]